jgi:hypothetical protein
MLLIRDYTRVTLNGMYQSIHFYYFVLFSVAGIDDITIGILLSGGIVVGCGVFRLSPNFNMKLDIAYYFESTCFIHLILFKFRIHHLHEERNMRQERLLRFPYFLSYALFENDFDMKLYVAYNLEFAIMCPVKLILAIYYLHEQIHQ